MLKLLSTLFLCQILLVIRSQAQQPQLVFPAANSNQLDAVTISPGEKYLATSDLDGKIKIWEVMGGHLLTTLQRENIYQLEFTTDDKHLVLASFAGAEVYNIATGQSKNLGNQKYCEGLDVSRDGKWIALSGEIAENKKITLWDAKTFELKHEFVSSFKNSELAFTPDSKALILYGAGTVERWVIDSKTFTTPFNGHSLRVISLDFSKDNTQMLSASDDKTARLWDLKTGKSLMTFTGHQNTVWDARFHPNNTDVITASSDNTGKIFDKTTGKLKSTLNGHEDWVYRARVSPDGKTFALGDAKGVCSIWDATTNKFMYAFQAGSETLYFLEYFKNSNLLTGTYDPVVGSWDVINRKKIIEYGIHNERFEAVRLSHNEKNLLVTSRDGVVRNIDVNTGRIIYYKKLFAKDWATSADFSPDDNLIAIAGGGSSTVVFNSAGGDEQTLSDHSSSYESFSKFSPDGKYILHDDNFSAQLIRLSDNRRLLTVDSTSMFTEQRFSPDSKYIITGGAGKVRIWSVLNQRLVTEVRVETNFPENIEISPDSKYFLSTDNDPQTLDIWELGSGKHVKHIEGIDNASFSGDGNKIFIVYMSGRVSKFSIEEDKETILANLENFSRAVDYYHLNGKFLISKSASNIRVWNLSNGKFIKQITGNELDYGKSLKYLYVVYDDVMKVYDMRTWNLAYSHYIVGEKDHLVQDDRGRYDGTEDARKNLYFVCGTEIIELDQAKDQLWVPDLAQRILANDKINARSIEELNICSFSPEIEYVSSEKSYSYTIKPRRGGLGETIVYINGIEAKRYKPEQLTRSGNNYLLSINKQELSSLFVPGKENTVSVKSLTADNSFTSRGLIVKEDKSKEAPPVPNLYAVMIGVSDYKGSELDLRYAAKDASDISSTLSRAAKKLLNSDGKEHVFVYNLTTSNDRYQFPEKNSIKKLMEEIGKKATANDILLIFFAGHGVMTGENDKKQFYFLTAEASTLSTTDAVKDVGISTAELVEWIKPQNLKAQKRILIFDACNSGQAINDIAGKDLAVRNDDKAQQIKAIDKLNEKSGLFILSASASNQSAYEMGRYSQGLLTYSLLKAIKQQPDILEDNKYLNVSRWFSAAEKTVAEVSRENGARQEPQVVTNTNFNIGVVDADVVASVILPQEKPLFAASNFQNSDEAIADDDLELSKMINLQLSDLASRGNGNGIVYVTATNSPDAYSLTGRYTVKDNSVSVTVNLKQNKLVKNKFEISGTKDKLGELAGKVAARAAEIVK